ncbi:MAG: sporulation protein YqfD [Clostridia bacterium]|nr:sporulation protein YqfD [Clostridia bacterium]
MKRFLYSKIEIIVSKKKKVLALDIILKNNLTYVKVLEKDEKTFILIYAKHYNQYKSVFEKYDIEYTTGKEYGLFYHFKKNKHRVGLFIGVFLFVLLSYFSSKLVWRINISGNEKFSDEEIEEILYNAGFSLGEYIPNIDYDELHNKVLLQSNEISWISININGTVANVEVKETLKEDNKDKSQYTNVISKYDGYISSVNVINGEKVVSAGNIVKKGDLLISGVINSQSEGVRFVHAEGDVRAYVNKEILIEIPLVSNEKQYTGKVYEEKKYKLFSKYINFSLKNSNYNDFCDKIEKTEPVSILGFNNLPFKKTTTKYYEYQIKEVTRTKEEAVELAFVELNKELDQALKTAELVSKTVNTYYKNRCVYIECDIYCLETISEEVQFFVD